MNAQIAEPIRSVLNSFCPPRTTSPDTSAFPAPAPCPSCKTADMYAVGRCEVCKVQFCLDCVSLAAGFPLCKACAPGTITDYLSDIAHLQNAVQGLREFTA